MGKAEARIYKALVLLSAEYPAGIDASMLAEEMHLSRNTVSHYLNRLYEDKLVDKTGKKPVLWKPLKHKLVIKADEANNADEAFASFIGWNDSLKNVVDQCKAAVRYPPKGLPILLTGQSGVGKSLLARLIYNYAIQEGIANDTTPFITFNCADYANNTQLISSALFGYKKGAFTGAQDDRTGIIQEANDGFLFLDEIHRLSFENQEKLFVVMDQGWYRPLGDNKSQKFVNVRFIFATTQDVDQTLLETFRRRIPVKLDIKPFSQRPLAEKIDLITHLYRQEAESLHKKLLIRPGVFDILSASDIEGNIGMLCNIIKLSCANAFNVQNADDMLTISAQNLPPVGIRQDKTISGNHSVSLLIDPYEEQRIYEKYAEGNSIRTIREKLQEVNDGEKLNAARVDFQQLAAEQMGDIDVGSVPVFESIFQRTLSQTLKQYGIILSNRELHTAFWAYRLCRGEATGRTASLANFEHLIKKEYPHTTYIINRLLLQLEKAFPEDTIWMKLFGALMFFILDQRIDEQLLLHGLIVAHGESTASSIASVANNLCNNFVFEAFDMPLDTTIKELIERIIQYINTINTRQGLIILVDMGSLDQMYSSIKNYVSGDLLIINNVSTSVAVDIGLRIKNKARFADITEFAKTGYVSKVQYFEGITEGENIIISCISGLGIANRIKEIIDTYIDQDHLETVTMDYRNLKQALDNPNCKDFHNTRLIITTSELRSNRRINILNLSSIYQNEGEKMLAVGLGNGLSEEQFIKLKAELLKLFSYEGVSSKLLFLNPNIIINEVSDVIEQYESLYNITMENYKRFNLYLHISIMIERLMVDNTEHKDISNMQIADEFGAFQKITNQIFAYIIEKYKIQINDYEMLLLYELLTC